MHIHTAVSHFVALATMAQEHMLLVKNQQCPDFIQDIQNHHDSAIWSGTFYTSIKSKALPTRAEHSVSTGLGKPKLMINSRFGVRPVWDDERTQPGLWASFGSMGI